MRAGELAKTAGTLGSSDSTSGTWLATGAGTRSGTGAYLEDVETAIGTAKLAAP